MYNSSVGELVMRCSNLHNTLLVWVTYLQEMDMTNRCCLYEHVVLTGGTSMLRVSAACMLKLKPDSLLHRIQGFSAQSNAAQHSLPTPGVQAACCHLHADTWQGLPSRVEKEMRQLFLQRVLHGDSAGLARLRLRLSDPPNRKHLAWLGGAVLADMMQVGALCNPCMCLRPLSLGSMHMHMPGQKVRPIKVHSGTCRAVRTSGSAVKSMTKTRPGH